MSDESRDALALLARTLEDPTDADSRKVLADLLAEQGHEAAAARLRELARFTELLAAEVKAEKADGQGAHHPIYDGVRMLRSAKKALDKYGEAAGVPQTDRLLRLLEIGGVIPIRP